ncbi:putative nuclease HARBI1 [Xyrichtys novacula]|uniref:Nuclease HARBI1 n=1 Tax=Xyrichtys novacula TaxID=13765 RepID=A0AAV1FZH8_XYRNO|nr:putative nuclease HARBI1 [Xyrichtys novacula]
MAGAMKLRWLFACPGWRDIFAIPRATVARIVHNVVEEMMIILHRAVHFPKLEDMEEVGAGFTQLAGHEAFRCVAGAIHGCHICVVPPAEPQKKSYINRKLFPSVVLQAVCDSSGKFLDTYVGNTSSVHDALVFQRSLMYKEYLYQPAGYVLLGDGGYPCLRHPVTIITPYRQPLAGDILEEEHHKSKNSTIENATGHSGVIPHARLAAQVSAPNRELPKHLREHDY